MLRGRTFLSISATLILHDAARLNLVENLAVDKANRILVILVFGRALGCNTHIVLKRRSYPRTLLGHDHLLSFHLIAAHLDADKFKWLES